MRKVAIFMSDFHLGQKNRMEEFHADEEFAELLGGLSNFHAEDAVDLVLLGDVVDLWTTVTNSNEERAETIRDVDLYLPVRTAAEIPSAEQKEAEKLGAILEKHPAFFEALGRFLITAPKLRRLIYVPGNHDHSIVCKRLQRMIVQAILTRNVMARFGMTEGRSAAKMTRRRLEKRIRFPTFYSQRYLQVYAEHGNQLTYGGIFRYDDSKRRSTFSHFGTECPGYVQFKAVSNRVQRSAPKLNGLLMGAFDPANWPGLAGWLFLRGYFRALLWLQRFRIQYSRSRYRRILDARSKLPPEWKTVLHLLTTRLFGVTKDEFGGILPKLFDETSDPLTMPQGGRKLDRRKVKTIVLGHSHGTKDVDMPGFDGLKYYNTGSWVLRRENHREVVEQTWVTVSRELPFILGDIIQNGSDVYVQLIDKLKSKRDEKLASRELLDGFDVGDEIYVEKNDWGLVSSILPNKTLSRTVINRQLMRRRVELPRMAYSPVTTDGKSLNDVLRSMDLRVGDLVLCHWKFGEYLRRILRTRPGTLLKVLPGVLVGAVNRLGTSSYWNHIAMIYGSPSERQESHHYNDPLIIEALPEMGVSIHTPQHYVEYPNEWNFAVLRLNSDWIDNWEARRLLRRITLRYLGVQYDQETVVRGTIKYAGLTLDAKRRSALGGAVVGGVVGVVLSSVAALWWVLWHVYANWTDWTKRTGRWTQDLLEAVGSGVKEFKNWEPNIAGVMVQGGELLLLVIALGVAAVVVGRLLRLLAWMWVCLTAAVGSVSAVCIVPVMADIAGGWSKRSRPEQIAFILIWFSPLLAILLFSWFLNLRPVDLPWKEVAQYYMVLLLTSGLVTLWFAEEINKGAQPVVNMLRVCRDRLKAVVREFCPTLGRSAARDTTESPAGLEKQFICSGLIQEALVQTARQLKKNVPEVVVNPDWEPVQSSEKQARVLRSTMPKHFALADKQFTWNYLYLDGVLTPNPSASHRMQAYSAPVSVKRDSLCQSSVYAIKAGFIGLALATYAASGNSEASMSTNHLFPIVASGGIRILLLWSAIGCGLAAITFSKRAQKQLAWKPTRRGRALTIYGWITGTAAAVVGLMLLGATGTIHLPIAVALSLLVFGFGSALLLFF